MADWTATLLTPAEATGWYGRCSAAARLWTGLLLALLVLLIDQVLLLLLPALVVVGLSMMVRLRPLQRRAFFGAIVLLLWGVMVSQGLFYQRVPREALITLIPPGDFAGWPFDGLRIYREGLLYGLSQSLRFVVLVGYSLLVTFTTPLHELLGGLRSLGIPGSLALMTLVALRSLPTLAREVLEVQRAMRLRRLTVWHLGLAGLLRPLLDRTLWRATTLAASLQLRGIDPVAPDLGPLPRMALHERSGLLLLGAVVLVALLARVLLLLYWRGWWYAPDWTSLYAFASWLASPIRL